MSGSPRPRVLMVTGAYFPETSGASLQCRRLIAALRDRADFSVLTTSSDPALPWQSTVDDVPVRRIIVDPRSRTSKAIATERMASALLELRHDIDVVHLHGVSQKSVLVTAMARGMGKPVVIKLTSFGHDDPDSIRASGRLSWWAYRQADRFIGVTPRFLDGFAHNRLDPARFVFIPNGVDLRRFSPASAGERRAAREQLRIPSEDAVVLFVGFFSRDKNPDILFDAWASLQQRGIRSTLVFVGATTGIYYEIDPSLAPRIRTEAARRGLGDRIVFVEATDTIEQYFRAADVFALPTAREGLPNVLLEAMASGVPPVITRLAGVTDWIVESGVNGELVPFVDAAAFAQALERMLTSPDRRARLGAAARAHVESKFDMAATAHATLAVYQELLSRRSS